MGLWISLPTLTSNECVTKPLWLHACGRAHWRNSLGRRISSVRVSSCADAIEADRLFSSIILWGPPGSGKTTLAMVIANLTKSHFDTLSAVLAGKAELREVLEAATERRKLYQKKTILFVDEVHRWNKAQQDALLPHVENGAVTLIGATTENPYFEVIGALVSRSRVFQLRPLGRPGRAPAAGARHPDPERGYGKRQIISMRMPSSTSSTLPGVMRAMP